MKDTFHIPSQQFESLQLAPINLITSRKNDEVKKQWKKGFSTLKKIYEILNDQTKDALALIKKLQATSPHSAELLNLEAFCYLKLKKKKHYQETVQKNYHLNPTNIMAFVNYAQFLLDKKKKKKAREMLNDCFDIQAVFTEKNAYSVNEFLGFYSLLSRYNYMMAKLPLAEMYWGLCYKIDPHSPSLKNLAKKIRRSKLIRNFFPF